jgi:transcription-repair coupling factor (superfamily II helicase)
LERLSFFKSSFPGEVPAPCRIFNLTGSSAALFLALDESPFVAVERDEAAAEALRRDIAFYRDLLSGGAVSFLPDPDGSYAAGRRAEILRLLGDRDSLVTSSKNMTSTFYDRDELEEKTIVVTTGGRFTRGEFETALAGLGYTKVPMVSEQGQYSRREWIVDVYPSTGGEPVRIEFFGDEIEEIKTFEVETQRSREKLDRVLLFPAAENAETRLLTELTGDRKFYCLYPPGEEDAFPEETVFLSRYSFGGGGEEGLEMPQIEAPVHPMRGHGILPEERKGMEELPEKVKRLSSAHRVIIIASSSAQSERLKGLFREKDIILPTVDLKELGAFEGRTSITAGVLSCGVFLDGLVILTEREIFGERPSFRPIRKSKVADLLVSIDDIAPGDYVVHRDHGVGRFSGVTRQRFEDTEHEVMMLDYENGRLYIPIQNIRNIFKYRAEEGTTPKVERLGGKTWEKKKERVRKRVREMAARLLALYAGRKIARGFSFSAQTELHREFDSFFAYEETRDQMKAIEDIRKDMESDAPMDRLVCGDVGYGKTEVAVRAAFRAVYDNRQVAVLVPTTILAEQHYRTFSERFSGFPVTVDYLSRFKTPKEMKLTLKGVAKGEVDIVIGTHALLSKRVEFHRLGLLIIDEEHRFGVGQKEKMKELAKNIDVLTLTATPIPRTLHMALSGIRNISVIETPPEERLSVRSIVSVFSDDLVRQAIALELQRDGQVFFVHNRIHDIYRIAQRIQELVPEARVGVAHGQMPEKELETVMHAFFRNELNVLVSTAIIGSGLDIPRANTIIIDKADKMGLADLYQLRGRVGRSNLRGYAYFLAPPESSLTDEAKKRLQAVQEMSYLGAGFRLALKDLEIRGAGDIFGAEQSGHIHEIGFDLYIEMLEKAVAELKGEEIREEREPAIELRASAFIPEEYIEDVTLRLSFYRRIASLKTEEDIGEFSGELRDRFGSLPEEVSRLLDVMRLKIAARILSVAKVEETVTKVKVVFSPDTGVEPAGIFGLHESRKGRMRFLPDGFEIDLRGCGPETAFTEIYGALKELEEKTTASSEAAP